MNRHRLRHPLFSYLRRATRSPFSAIASPLYITVSLSYFLPLSASISIPFRQFINFLSVFYSRERFLFLSLSLSLSLCPHGYYKLISALHVFLHREFLHFPKCSPNSFRDCISNISVIPSDELKFRSTKRPFELNREIRFYCIIPPTP